MDGIRDRGCVKLLNDLLGSFNYSLRENPMLSENRRNGSFKLRLASK